jgi:hypothetical protein
MFFIHFIFALFFALLLSAIFSLGLRKKGPRENLFLFFIIIFLAAWAGGIWLDPFGPFLWGVPWLPFLFAGLIFSFILAAVSVPPPRESSVELVDEKSEEIKREFAVRGVTIFIWFLVGALIFSIIVRYIL